MGKNNISVKEHEKTKWDFFLEDLVNGGVDFSLQDAGNTISIYLPECSTGYSILLHRNRRYNLE